MRPTAAASLAVLLSLPATAQDDGGFNAHGINVAPQDGDLRDPLTLYRPGAMSRGEWFASGVIEYARKPLVLVTERQGQEPRSTTMLDHLLALHATGGVVVDERLRFGLAAPIYANSTGFSGSQGASLGDLRIDALAVARSPEVSGVGFGATAWFDLPTGSARRFLGRRTVAGGAAAMATYEADRLTLTGNLGLQLEPSVDLENLKGADQLLAGAAAAYSLSDRTAIGLEAALRASLASNERAWTGSPAEALLTVRHRDPSGGHFVGGIAAPLSRGVGAAAFRVFIGGGFGRTGPSAPRDRDGDGIPDKLDACPLEPETVNGYIDEDGCPDQLATLEIVTLWQGQPIDGAELVITGPLGEERGTSSAEPWRREVVPETMWGVVARKGDCLSGEAKKLVNDGVQRATVELALVPSAVLRLKVTDEAGQAVPGARVLWDTKTPECVPDAPALDRSGRARTDIGPGEHRIVVGAPGYRVSEVPVYASRGDELEIEIKLKATKLRVEKKRIVILDKVQFEFNKAAIKAESFDLLNEVAEVIARNPDAGRVEIQGHTDDRGRPAYNLDLSQRRADAVREYLIGRGVPAERLISKGFGMTAPITTNQTEDGRAANRRVEFVLIDQAQQAIEEPAPTP
jgi:OmpA-OmpF porin, OOP family